MIEGVYKLEFITPLIMAGSNPKELELRTQSIKGALRWWYRFRKAFECASLGELKRSESEIWGSTDGASKVALFIAEGEDGPWRAVLKPSSRPAYLCMNDQRPKGVDGALKPYDRIKRPSFQGKLFLKLVAKERRYLEEAEDTLGFLSSFGGLGARWRRGFGSVEVYRKEGSRWTFLEVGDELLGTGSPRAGSEFHMFPNLGSVGFWKLEPSGGVWLSWSDAMNSIRDNFFRPLKSLLGLKGIGRSANPRWASPLIISIKRKGRAYYGIVMLHRYRDAWQNSDSFLNRKPFQRRNFNDFLRDFNLSRFSSRFVGLRLFRL